MGFLAAPIVGFLGLTGAAALIGEGIIGIGLSFGVSYLAKKLQPKSSSASAQGMQLSLSYDINGPRQIPFGKVASAGTLVYHNVYGPNGNDYVQLVFKLADVPCTSLEGVIVAGKTVTLGDVETTAHASGRKVTEYPGAMWIEFHDGAWDQAADADLVAHSTSSPSWSTNHRGRGVCYVRVTLKFDAKLYKSGLPAFVWVFKGAKLYDWRKDSTNGGTGAHRWNDESTREYSDNATVCLYNFMRGINVNGIRVGGMNAPPDSLPAAAWTAAANACDEDVSLKSGGTEKRYRLNGIVSVDTENATVVRDMLSAMAGSLADASGVFKPYPGVAQTPVLTISDADLISDVELSFVPNLSRSNLVNAVFGSFSDPAQNYQSAALPPRISPDDIEADGGVELSANYALDYVSSGTQGQRILEIFRRRNRFQHGLTFSMRASGAVLEAGDWVTVNFDRYGLSGLVCEVVQGTLNRDATVPLELREVSGDIYAWSPVDDELDPLVPHDVGAGSARFSTITGILVQSILFETEGGEQTPGLQISWDAVTDPTVTGLVLEYRKVGDTAFLPKAVLNAGGTAEDPDRGEITVLEGIQGGVTYEARLRLVTMPDRATTATAWTPTDNPTDPQVVAVAALANNIPDGVVTPAKLSAQTLLELRINTELSSVQASVSDRVDRMRQLIQQTASDALGLAATNQEGIRVTQQRISTLTVSFSQFKVDVTAALQDPVTGIPAVAAAVSSLESRVEITEEGIAAASARAYLGIAIYGSMGLISGGIDIFGNDLFSSVGITANRFFILDPSADPSDPAAQPFVIGQRADGSTGVIINVPLTVPKGGITSDHMTVERLDAITGHMGEMITGKLRRPDNLVYFDLDQGEIRITTPQMMDFRFRVNLVNFPCLFH